MEKTLKFNSQVATNRSQSERLLALGLKKETADMCWHKTDKYSEWEENAHSYEEWITEILPLVPSNIDESLIPAWSLARLVEMMPDIIKDNIEGMLYHLSIDGNSVFYETRNNDLCQFFGDSLYICIIDCIEWLIKEGYFNKEYLV